MKVSDLLPKNILGLGNDDAVSLLIADHDKVKAMFKRFEDIKETTGQRASKEKQQIVADACRELIIHTKLEEELFYPAVRKPIGDEDMMNEAVVEHVGAKELIAQLEKMTPADGMFNAKFTVLAEYVQHHIKEEQNEMFPKARETGVDLEALGQKMQARKEVLMAAPAQANKRSPTRKHASGRKPVAGRAKSAQRRPTAPAKS